MSHYRDVPSLARNYAVAATFEGTAGQGRGNPRAARGLDAKAPRHASRRNRAPVAFSRIPPHVPAGKLVDELGLKETRVGGARVSAMHGNFIVNDGNATAADVLALIDKIKAVAREQRGIELETEVQILGES